MKKIYTLSLLTMASIASFAQAFTATYDFSGVTTTSGLTDPTAVPTAAGMVFSSFSAVNPVSTNANSAGRFSFANQPLGATNGNDTFSALIGNPDVGTYTQVTVTPNTGTTYNVTGITFTSQRSGTGSRTYVVRSSVDNYIANLPASINPANADLSVQSTNVFFRVNDLNAAVPQVGSTITLSGSSFTGITVPVTFRIYGYNAEAAGGNFSIDDVVISGNVTALNTTKNEIAGLSIYPNPAKDGKLFITSNANENKQVLIFDLLGKQVLKTNISTEAVNISSLTSGAYFVKVTENGKIATRKLLVQ